MTRKPTLTVVHPGAPPPKKRPVRAMSVTKAAAGGDRRDLLVALRARIATAVESPNIHPRDLAQLSRQILEIAKDIALVDAIDEGDDVGQAAATPDEPFEP